MNSSVKEKFKSKKFKSRLGQALVEYAVLTSMTVALGIGLSSFYSQNYWKKVYDAYTTVIAQPIPMNKSN